MPEEARDLGDTFDAWYAAMAAAPAKDEMVQRHLGLPAELLSTSTLSWDALAEVTTALALKAGETLVDLACGRGGYGLEVASRSRASLVGIDLSSNAIQAARELAARRGVVGDFRVGNLVATGLDDRAADAVMVIDAIQFPPHPDDAYREIRRILRPRGRVVLTCWEARDRDDEQVPALLRSVNLAAGLTAAGFEDVEVLERATWLEAERGLWRAAADVDPGGAPALVAFHEEGLRALPLMGHLRRVLATATRPHG